MKRLLGFAWNTRGIGVSSLDTPTNLCDVPDLGRAADRACYPCAESAMLMHEFGWRESALRQSTCIEDLAAARAPEGAEDVLRLCRGRAPMPRKHCAQTAPTSSGSSCASACWSTSRGATSTTTIVGEPVPLPLALAPIGLCGMQWGTARFSPAAPRRRPASRSAVTMSICSIEDVAAAVDKPFWFQLYVMKDRGFVAVADRARRGRQMQRAGADHRPAGARPAPLRHA